MAFGPVMIDIESTQLNEQDKILLKNPLVGGLILFARNFESAEQVLELTESIRQVNDKIIIAVDQEGGRVQRFTSGFSKLPALGSLGELYQNDAEQACQFASALGELMALEVQSVGCDISFAPVLDLGHPQSTIIGARAFSTKADEINILAKHYIGGMKAGGMQATGKHFPGHGSIVEDSHLEIPYDHRSFDEIAEDDLTCFKALSSDLGGMMPAHIIYDQVDDKPAGFSSIWLQEILRQQLNFNGVIFSDDLSMEGAAAAGSFTDRADAALSAGCDMILVCNNRDAALQVLQHLKGYKQDEVSKARIEQLAMKEKPSGLKNLKKTEKWQQLSLKLENFEELFK